MPATPIPDLHAEMPAAFAVRDLLLELLRQMRERLPRLLEDRNPEELHQYRIAIRKTRAALSLLGDWIGKKDAKRFRKRLAVLGRASNRLRDLDVFLLEEPTLKAMLPEEVRDGLSPFFERIRVERKQVFRQLSDQLTGEEATTLLDEWETFLTGLDIGENFPKANGSRVGPLARERILHQYGLVDQAVSPIDASSPPYQLHEVRIEIKKLRYLVEFFAPLFPSSSIKPFVKRLKRFQEHLGTYNDCAMQHELLQAGLQERFGPASHLSHEMEPLTLLIEAVRLRAEQERAAFTLLVEEGRSSGLMDYLRASLEQSLQG